MFHFLRYSLGPAGAVHAATVFLTNGGEVIVRMRGLPFDAKVSDIVSVFLSFLNFKNCFILRNCL